MEAWEITYTVFTNSPDISPPKLRISFCEWLMKSVTLGSSDYKPLDWPTRLQIAQDAAKGL